MATDYTRSLAAHRGDQRGPPTLAAPPDPGQHPAPRPPGAGNGGRGTRPRTRGPALGDSPATPLVPGGGRPAAAFRTPVRLQLRWRGVRPVSGTAGRQPRGGEGGLREPAGQLRFRGTGPDLFGIRKGNRSDPVGTRPAGGHDGARGRRSTRRADVARRDHPSRLPRGYSTHVCPALRSGGGGPGLP